MAAATRSTRDFYDRTFEDAWIVSVFWRPKREEVQGFIRRPGGVILPGGFRNIILPAAPRDGYSIAKVESGGDFIPTFPNPDTKPGIQHIARSGTEIAVQLVESMTRAGGENGGMPGIAVLPAEHIIGTDEEGRPIPSDEFLARLHRQQEPLAHYRVNRGNLLFAKDPTSVQETHRQAARYLYGEDAKNQFPWMRGDLVRKTKPCPRCGTDNQAQALGCVACPCDFAQFYLRRGMTAEDVEAIDPVVAMDMRDLGAKTKPKPAAEALQRMSKNWKADDSTGTTSPTVDDGTAAAAMERVMAPPPAAPTPAAPTKPPEKAK